MRLAAHAANVLPPNRKQWAEAMRAELGALPGGLAAIEWALGCVAASYFERIKQMKLGTINVGRIVLTLEMLLCFVPLTGMFVSMLFPNPVLMAVVPGPNRLFYLTWAAVGPIGLLAAFMIIVREQRSLGTVLTGLLCLSGLWAFVSYGFFWQAIGDISTNWLRGYVMLGILPALGAAHLVYLSRSARASSSHGWA
ncbi:MAG: hypothetical protein R3305_08640 [Gammaproteobacteria bacterium]|nr:hypothetical protein [Gammaproteobacteria bacterium]